MPVTRVSVVIACVNGLPYIDECLAALERERGQFDVEIIVSNCCDDGTAEHIRKQFPSVKLLNFTERVGIPALRAEGMSRATGDIISILEDHCNVREGWFRELIKAHRQGYMAVGGTVENGSVDRIIDWAVFLCEYSGVMPPAPEGEVEAITGNNASYRKEVLDSVDDSVKRDCWEFFLHEELKKTGVRFLSAPSVVVSHKKTFSFFYFLSQRYHYSRSFAAMRRARVTNARRILYLCCAPILPGLMFLRVARHIVRKRRHIDKFLLSLPALSAFLVSYAVGEFMGYLAGPGTSLLRVE